MSNTLITPTWVSNESMRLLENYAKFPGMVETIGQEDYMQGGAKIGATYNKRFRPQSWTLNNSPAANVSAVVEVSLPIVLTNQTHIDFQFSSYESTLDVQRFSERYLDPVVVQLANGIDSSCLQTTNNLFATAANPIAYASLASGYGVFNTYGVPGTSNGIQDILNAGNVLDNYACPRDNNRSIIMSPKQMSVAVPNFVTLFNPTSNISKIYESGLVDQALGFDKWAISQNIPKMTNGAFGTGAITVSGANQSGSTITITGLPASTSNVLLGGETFVIGSTTSNGVFSAQPMTGNSTDLQQFMVVGGPYSSNGSGTATVSIYPALAVSTSGTNPGNSIQQTTVPANGAAITFVGAAGATYYTSLAFHKGAYCFASAELETVADLGAYSAVATDKELGLSFRIGRQWNVSTDQTITRGDVLWGLELLRPGHATRLVY